MLGSRITSDFFNCFKNFKEILIDHIFIDFMEYDDQ